VRARRAVAVAGSIALAGVLLAMLLHSGPRRAGTDSTPDGVFVASLLGGQKACQGAERLPADTASLRITVGTYGKPGPPLGASVTAASGQVLTSGVLKAGWRQGIISIPVRRVRTASEPVQVCFANLQRGHSTPIVIAGDLGDPGYTMQIAGHTAVDARLRIDYMRPGSETWLSMLPAIAHRLTLARSGIVRHWDWIAFPLLMILAVGLALRLVLAETGRARSEGGR
jgi:hypothetical protein